MTKTQISPQEIEALMTPVAKQLSQEFYQQVQEAHTANKQCLEGGIETLDTSIKSNAEIENELAMADKKQETMAAQIDQKEAAVDRQEIQAQDIAKQKQTQDPGPKKDTTTTISTVPRPEPEDGNH